MRPYTDKIEYAYLISKHMPDRLTRAQRKKMNFAFSSWLRKNTRNEGMSGILRYLPHRYCYTIKQLKAMFLTSPEYLRSIRRK